MLTRRGLVAAALAAPAAAQAGQPSLVARAFRAWAESVGTQAANMAIIRDGRLIEALGWGTRAANDRAPIWSLSKSITATCVAGLADDGLLSLHAPIGDHLRGLRPEMAAITAAQLITHRSGLTGKTAFGALTQAVGLMLTMRPPEQLTFADLAPAMLDLVPTNPPGAGFVYSNLNYFFLGQLIEAVTHATYVDVCNARLLQPAGIPPAGLDPRWGRLLWSTGGWLLAPAEYLAFAATLAPGGRAGRTARAFLPNVPAAGAPPNDPMRNYTLGMIWQPSPTGPFMLHNGSWTWRQPDAHPPLDEDAGAQFRRWPDGVMWCATCAGISSDGTPEAYAALAGAISRLRGSVR